jgi:hypothetical protein
MPGGSKARPVVRAVFMVGFLFFLRYRDADSLILMGKSYVQFD